MTSSSPHRRLADHVARAIRDRIVSGEWAAGHRVDPATIAADLGVSRTPVREALVRLEADGLVMRQPYRGTVVTGVDVQRLEEVTALRIDLEGRATALGVPRLTDAEVERMASLLDELEARTGDRDFSLGGFNELNRGFHGVVYDAADSPVLAGLVAGLNDEADRLRLHFDMRAPLAEVHHRRILDACRRRDVVAAVEATRLHLLESYLGMTGSVGVPVGGVLADVLTDLGIDAR